MKSQNNNAIVCKTSSFKGEIRQKNTENLLFMTPVLHVRGTRGKPDWLYRHSIYGIHSKAVKAIIKEIQRQKKKSAIL